APTELPRAAGHAVGEHPRRGPRRQRLVRRPLGDPRAVGGRGPPLRGAPPDGPRRRAPPPEPDRTPRGRRTRRRVGRTPGCTLPRPRAPGAAARAAGPRRGGERQRLALAVAPDPHPRGVPGAV